MYVFVKGHSVGIGFLLYKAVAQEKRHRYVCTFYMQIPGSNKQKYAMFCCFTYLLSYLSDTLAHSLCCLCILCLSCVDLISQFYLNKGTLHCAADFV